jgi:hypothetical protein
MHRIKVVRAFHEPKGAAGRIEAEPPHVGCCGTRQRKAVVRESTRAQHIAMWHTCDRRYAFTDVADVIEKIPV